MQELTGVRAARNPPVNAPVTEPKRPDVPLLLSLSGGRIASSNRKIFPLMSSFIADGNESNCSEVTAASCSFVKAFN